MEAPENRDIHRIGGASVENLRLKLPEVTLDVPGISVLKCSNPGEAAQQVRNALPHAKRLHAAAKIVGSTTEDLIRAAGFDIIAAPSKAQPNHHRIIHPAGAEGFSDENLDRLVQAFLNTTGH